jgi:hypothetical protein
MFPDSMFAPGYFNPRYFERAAGVPVPVQPTGPLFGPGRRRRKLADRRKTEEALAIAFYLLQEDDTW